MLPDNIVRLAVKASEINVPAAWKNGRQICGEARTEVLVKQQLHAAWKVGSSLEYGT
jgi:hypothetical protein